MQIFAFFGLFTNFFVSLAMMYASVAVLNATTGADIYALAFLIPLGVSAYAIVGGLKVCFASSHQVHPGPSIPGIDLQEQ